MKYSINKNGNWKLYQPTLPANCEAIGVISDDTQRLGALVQFDSGLYALMVGGVVSSLDQGDVVVALVCGQVNYITL